MFSNCKFPSNKSTEFKRGLTYKTECFSELSPLCGVLAPSSE